MSLHEVEIKESLIRVEYDMYILQEKIDFILQNADISNLEALNENKLKREAAMFIKRKFPDADIKFGDWID